MLRRLILEFLLPLLLFWFIRSLFRGSSSPSPARRDPRESATVVPPGGELKKDPVCGTYVSTASALSRKVAGETVYFCSADCRDRFQG
jgi:YHS domain-containing protein